MSVREQRQRQTETVHTLKGLGRIYFTVTPPCGLLCVYSWTDADNMLCMLIDLWLRATVYLIKPICRGAEMPACVFCKTVQLHERFELHERYMSKWAAEPKETWQSSVQRLIGALLSCCCLVSHAQRCWHQNLARLWMKAPSSLCVDKSGSELSPHSSELWNKLFFGGFFARLFVFV